MIGFAVVYASRGPDPPDPRELTAWAAVRALLQTDGSEGLCGTAAEADNS